MLAGQRADQLQLGPAEHLAGGVVRRVQQDQAGPVGERGAQRGLVHSEVRESQDRCPAGGAGQGDRGGIAVVVRLEGHHLVTDLAQGQDHCGDGLGRPGSDQYLPVRVNREPVEPSLMLRDGLAQFGHPRARGVLVAAGADCQQRGVQHLAWPVDVWETLPEVDRAGAGRQLAHLGEDRGTKAAHPGNKWISHVRQASRTMRTPQVRPRRIGGIRASTHRPTTGVHHRGPECFGRGALAGARHEYGNPAGLVDNRNERK